MKDISSWPIIGFGENSTLEKFETVSPQGIQYVMKFPRPFDGERTNWEDFNEVIASQIAKMLGLSAVTAEIAYYKGRRGCLMHHFGQQYNVEDRETVASLMAGQFESDYEDLHRSLLPNKERMNAFLLLFEQFKHYNVLKEDFVYMNLFDILIGNQDRHGHNWQLLFKQEEVFPSPFYDNGASLGWQLPEERLEVILASPKLMHNLFNNTLLKIGLDNNQSPKIKVSTILGQLTAKYPTYCKNFKEKIVEFDSSYFEQYCESLPLISEVRKKFLVQYISYRQQQIIEKLKGE